MDRGGLKLSRDRPALRRQALPAIGRTAMGLGERIRNAAEKIGGKGKEATGQATGNDRLKAEGKGTHAKAEFKDVGEKVKGAFRKKH